MLFLSRALRNVSLSNISTPAVRKISTNSYPQHDKTNQVLTVMKNVGYGYLLTVLGGGILGSVCVGCITAISELSKGPLSRPIIEDADDVTYKTVFGMVLGFAGGVLMTGLAPIIIPIYAYYGMRKILTKP